jgi:thymidylate kinase
MQKDRLSAGNLYKSFTIIGQSFKCDKDCPYCTAKITKWPLADDRWNRLPSLLERADQNGVRFNYATLSGNGEPAMNDFTDLRFIRRCLATYEHLFTGYRLQTGGYAFFRPEIMELFAGWSFEVTRVSFDSQRDMKMLRYDKDYLQTEAFWKTPIVLNIVLLKGLDIVAEINRYAAYENVKAINLIILNANTLDNGFDNRYSKWILEHGTREVDAPAIVTEVSKHFSLTKSYDDRFDSYEWQHAAGIPILMYARQAPYGLRNLVFHQGRFIDYHLNEVKIEAVKVNRKKVIIDGNDGTGKSTLIKALAEIGYDCQDRGLPTKMTDDPNSRSTVDDEVYIILDASVEVCRNRLAKAGRDLDEKYHRVEDLNHYRRRFLEVAANLPTAVVVDADRTIEEIVYDCALYLSKHGILPA